MRGNNHIMLHLKYFSLQSQVSQNKELPFHFFSNIFGKNYNLGSTKRFTSGIQNSLANSPLSPIPKRGEINYLMSSANQSRPFQGVKNCHFISFLSNIFGKNYNLGSTKRFASGI